MAHGVFLAIHIAGGSAGLVRPKGVAVPAGQTMQAL
jgi:hypothetical protein